MPVGAAAVIFGISNLASAATIVPCKGGTLTPICTSPVISPSGGLGVACRKAGTRIKVPPITITSNSGLRRITVTLRSTPRTLKTFNFKSPGPLRKTVKGITINTTGLSPGLHSLTITATDFRGKTSSKVRRFTICPPPKFTG